MIANVPIAPETDRIIRSMVRLIVKERSVPLFLRDSKRATRLFNFPK
jgi:hypothetical protein